MKKAIFSAAVLLGSLATVATVTARPTVTNGVEVTLQDEYTEVSMDAVPEAVKATVTNSFPKAALKKAYVNDKKEYKLEIAMGDKNFVVFTDATGAIIKK